MYLSQFGLCLVIHLIQNNFYNLAVKIAYSADKKIYTTYLDMYTKQLSTLEQEKKQAEELLEKMRKDAEEEKEIDDLSPD